MPIEIAPVKVVNAHTLNEGNYILVGTKEIVAYNYTPVLGSKRLRLTLAIFSLSIQPNRVRYYFVHPPFIGFY